MVFDKKFALDESQLFVQLSAIPHRKPNDFWVRMEFKLPYYNRHRWSFSYRYNDIKNFFRTARSKEKSGLFLHYTHVRLRLTGLRRWCKRRGGEGQESIDNPKKVLSDLNVAVLKMENVRGEPFSLFMINTLIIPVPSFRKEKSILALRFVFWWSVGPKTYLKKSVTYNRPFLKRHKNAQYAQ